ncbi:MAG: hypothetical protein ABI184_09155, partial [Ginsengibacter sp.]
ILPKFYLPTVCVVQIFLQPAPESPASFSNNQSLAHVPLPVSLPSCFYRLFFAYPNIQNKSQFMLLLISFAVQGNDLKLDLKKEGEVK